MDKNREQQPDKRVKKFYLALAGLIIFLCSVSVHSQDISFSQQESDAQVSQMFCNIGYEIANSTDINTAKVEQAIVFFKAAMELDKISDDVLPSLFRIIREYSRNNYSELVSTLLVDNLNDRTEVGVINDAVSYLLNRTNSREERERTLASIMQTLGSKNSYLYSELLTSYGMLRLEASDPNASVFFVRAYNMHKLNRLALSTLTDLEPNAINPIVKLEHIRLILGENPFDLDNAIFFAENARLIELYQTSSDSYEYCSDLYNYLYPSKPLPAYIYIPWAFSAYNSERGLYKCAQIAKKVQQSNRFDLVLDAIAAKAAIKTGDTEEGEKLLEETEKQAKKIYFAEKETEDRFIKMKISRELAWFYCFASPDANQALVWAKEADRLEPNSPITSSFLAYALVMNKQIQPAKELVAKFPGNQVAELTTALIQLDEGQKDMVIATLKSCISKDSGSLEAEIAKQLMADNGEKYRPVYNKESILQALESSMNRRVVPVFSSPDKIMKVELNLRGSRFAYGKDFGASIIIKNTWTEPLVISDYSFFSGNFRIDANIKGDIEKRIPGLVVMKYQPTLQIEPGKSLVIPVKLFTSQLRQILIRHPQASVGVEFTLYLDPVIVDNKSPVNRLSDIKPIIYRISRQPVKINSMVIQREVESISSGQESQKVTSATLFAGLLAEQYDIAKGRVFYKSSFEDWMTDVIKAALVKAIQSDDWVTKTLITGIMTNFTPDSSLISSISENLQDTHWPCRLTALYILATNSPTFQNVLDWTAKYDTNKTVREMAVAFGAPPYEPEPEKPEVKVPDINEIEPNEPAVGI